MFPLSALGGMFGGGGSALAGALGGGAGGAGWGPVPEQQQQAQQLQQRMAQLQAAAGNPAAPAMTTPYNTPGPGYVPYPGGDPTAAGGYGAMLQQAGQQAGAAGLPPYNDWDPAVREAYSRAGVPPPQQQAGQMGGGWASPGGYADGWGPMLQQAGQMAGAMGPYGMQKPMGGGLSPLAPWLGSLMGRGITPWSRGF